MRDALDEIKTATIESWFRFDCAHASKFKKGFRTCVERVTAVTNAGSPIFFVRFRFLSANQKGYWPLATRLLIPSMASRASLLLEGWEIVFLQRQILSTIFMRNVF